MARLAGAEDSAPGDGGGAGRVVLLLVVVERVEGMAMWVSRWAAAANMAAAVVGESSVEWYSEEPEELSERADMMIEFLHWKLLCPERKQRQHFIGSRQSHTR
jgi:hypothetical protein